MLVVLNNLIKFFTTNKAPNEITYRFKTYKVLNLMRLNNYKDDDINEENSLSEGKHVIETHFTNTVDVQNNMPILED